MKKKVIRLTESEFVDVVRKLATSKIKQHLNESEENNNLSYKLSNNVFFIGGNQTVTFNIYENGEPSDDVDFSLKVNGKKLIVTDINDNFGVSPEMIDEMKQIINKLFNDGRLKIVSGTYSINNNNVDAEINSSFIGRNINIEFKV